jgi:hypothetical protein
MIYKSVFFTILMLSVFIVTPETFASDIKLAELPWTGGTQPQVVSQQQLQIEELPRTGIPVIAWAAAALAPLGFAFFRKGKSTELSHTKLWEKRELEK